MKIAPNLKNSLGENVKDQELGFYIGVAIKMIIRGSQVEQMTQAKKEESSRRMLVEIRQSAPESTSHLDDESLLAIIDQSTEKARGYGVKSSESTTSFVKIAVFAGVDFDQEPAVQQFLRTPELDPDYKVKLLAELVSEKMNKSV